MSQAADQDSPLDVPPTRLRIGAAAASLGVSVDTLRRWEKEGRIHFERVGNQRVISSEEVERLLRDRPARARTSSARNRLEGTVVAIKRGRVHIEGEVEEDVSDAVHVVRALLGHHVWPTPGEIEHRKHHEFGQRN